MKTQRPYSEIRRDYIESAKFLRKMKNFAAARRAIFWVRLMDELHYGGK